MNSIRNKISLTKSKYCKGIQCLKMLWMELNMPEQFDQSVLDEARMETGNVVGNLTKSYFGMFAEVPFAGNKSDMIAETRHLLDARTNIIAEASFPYANNFCRVDILRAVEGGHELIEVKSSTVSQEDGLNKIKVVR